MISILFIIFLAGFVYWRYLDFGYSSEMILFDRREGNPLFRDKWGYMHKTRALAFQVLAVVLLFFLQFRVGPLGQLFNWFDSNAGEAVMPRWFPLVVAIVMNGLGFWLVRAHIEGRAESRTKQYAKLDEFKAEYKETLTKDELQYNIPFLRNIHGRHNRRWFNGLPHVYVENSANPDQAFAVLVKALDRLTRLPRERWFEKEYPA